MGGDLAEALRLQRLELAGQVHDQIIPPLLAARLQLEALARRSQQFDQLDPNGTMQEGIERAVGWLQDANTAARALLAETAPQGSGQEHWQQVLRNVHRQISARGGRPRLQVQGQVPWQQLAPETSLVLAQVIGEAIRNAVRHAQAQRVDVVIESPPVEQATPQLDRRVPWRVTVRDDGIGFDPDAGSDHHGLALMRLRAAAIGAVLEIDSRAGGPTEVRISPQ